ncbi:ribosome assembly factor SBDS [Candidatus Woesearchaeota archaeon]|nr:ribosome assembly factor SBDS [Candidatus Woesearchaeota archaeon]
MADHMHIVRVKHGSEVFEIVVDPDLAYDFKDGKSVSIGEVLKFPKIFSDAKKGLAASESRLEIIFGTSDVSKVAEQIIRKGDIPVTSARLKLLQDQKRRRILDILHSNGVDPRTNAPHPLVRLESALVEARIRIDSNKSAEEQVQSVLKSLLPIIPIKFVTKELEVRIPSSFAAKSYSSIKNIGKILMEEWLGDGSWKGLVEIPGGLEEDISSKLMSLTKGSVAITLVRMKE